MIIQSSRIELESTHYLNVDHRESVYRRESEVPANRETVQISITGEARSMAESYFSSATTLVKKSAGGTAPEASAPAEEDAATSRDSAKLDVLLKTLEKITGKKFHFSKVVFTLQGKPQSDISVPTPVDGETPPPAASGGDRNRMRRIETYTEAIHHEEESTAVDLSGTVKTADGREIALDVSLSMSREFYEKQSAYTLTIAPLTDPLVINYAGSVADLTDEKYSFDLNADGQDEQISFVTPGSGGFLAMDRNRDGVINDGSELFGTTSGNGFAELAAYDGDNNGWIDAGDSIYADLSVWEKSGDGQDRLIALADTGIGAVYLDAASSPFRITDNSNQTLGQVRSTGIYLMEDGSAGTVQQIDLAT